MKWKLFILLSLTFIAFTIIGTQTHELGHYAAAKYLGMKPTLHYQSVEFGEGENEVEINKILKQYQKEIYEKKDFPLKERYLFIEKKYNQNDFYSRLWGPLQTMLTGSIGFILLIIYREKYFYTTTLNWKLWLMIFISLFWLREVFNTTAAIILFLFSGRKEFFGDEFILSADLSLPAFAIPIITAIVGLIVCSIVVFKFVPASQRKTFIATGLVGGIVGFVFWMYILGPILLP